MAIDFSQLKDQGVAKAIFAIHDHFQKDL